MEHLYQPPETPEDLVIVLLHGKGKSHKAMLERGKKLLPGAGLLSLKGTVKDEKGNRRHFLLAPDGSFDLPDLHERATNIAAFVREAADRYHMDIKKLLAVGYSNGANALLKTLLVDPTLFSGVALWRPIKRYQIEQDPKLQNLHILINAGEKDRPTMKDLPALSQSLKAAGANVDIEVIEGADHEMHEDDFIRTRLWMERLLSSSKNP